MSLRSVNWRRILGGVVIVALAIMVGLVTTSAASQVEIRNFLFTRWDRYPGPLAAPPTNDQIETSAPAWQAALHPAFEQLPWLPDTLASIGRDPDVSSRARRLVGVIARGGRGRCLGDIPLAGRVGQLRQGKGCCSDHSKVFMALGALSGLYTREISFENHVVVEYYRSRGGTWEFIDPLFAVQAVDTTGALLSVSGLWEAVRAHGGARLVPIDSLGQWMIRQDSRFRAIYYSQLPEASSLRLTLGSDVIHWDQAEQRLRFLARPVRLFGLYLSGDRPRYAGLRPGAADGWRRVRNLSAEAVLMGLLLSPIAGLGGVYYSIRRRR